MLLSGLYQVFFLIRNLRLIGNISHLLVNVQLVLMSYVSESGFSEWFMKSRRCRALIRSHSVNSSFVSVGEWPITLVFFFCNLWHIYPDGVTVQRELCITDTHTDSEGRVSCALTSLALSDISVRLKPENGRVVKTWAVSHGLTYTGLQSYEPRREVSDDKTKVRFFFFFFSFAVPNNKREAGHRLVWAGGCGIWELS